jgi:glycosyl-4,4'-diaponeurosporenoate acyltransferase
LKYFIDCFFYVSTVGLAAFFFGRLLAAIPIPTDVFPFKSYPFEQNGKFFQKIKIRMWQGKLPDMSRIFPALLPPKRMEGMETDRQLERMIRETCVAEITHVLLCILGLRCIRIWRGIGGLALSALNITGNLPFILAQRYNRPRLVRLYIRTKINRNGAGVHCHARLNFNK